MKNVILPNLNKVILIWLAVMMVFVVVDPEPAQARRYLSNGGSGGGQSGEGDPLDANDYGTGGGGLIGDDVHNSYGLIESGGGGVIVNLPSSDASLVLVLDFRGKIPVIQLIRVSSREAAVEETNAR
jgi:hypothetical protein